VVIETYFLSTNGSGSLISLAAQLILADARPSTLNQTVRTSYQQLYYPKRTPQQTLGIVLIVLGAILLLAYGIGLVFLVPGILLWYYGR